MNTINPLASPDSTIIIPDYSEGLSEESILNIFSYLSVRELNRVAQCCKRFKRLSGDKVLWEGFLKKWQGFGFYIVNRYTQQNIDFSYRYPNDETGRITFMNLCKSLKFLADMVNLDTLKEADYVSQDQVRYLTGVLDAKIALCAMNLLSYKNAMTSICKANEIAQIADMASYFDNKYTALYRVKPKFLAIDF